MEPVVNSPSLTMEDNITRVHMMDLVGTSGVLLPVITIKMASGEGAEMLLLRRCSKEISVT